MLLHNDRFGGDNGREWRADKGIRGHERFYYLTNDADGIRLHRQFEPEVFIPGMSIVDLTATFIPPIKIADAVTDIGQTVNSTGIARTNDLPGVGVLDLLYSARFTVEAFESINVPAGNFHVVRLRGTITIDGEVASSTIYAARNIGIVKDTETFDGFTFTLELIETNVTPAKLSNISTRGLVQTGDNVQIGGFIIGGTEPKTVLVRARGPVLADFGVSGVLDDPFLQLFSGQTVIADNDNWETTLPLCQNSGLCGPPEEIIATGLDPCMGNLTGCARESAILVMLDPGPYTAIVSGGTGVGLVEVFEVGTGTSRLTNISTRGVVGTGDDVMIGGFIIGGSGPKTVLIRARGPVLRDFGVPGELADPFLQLFSGQTVIARNDNWQVTDPLCVSPAVSCGGAQEIIATGLDPCVGNMTGCSQESAILVTLPPGPYTAIVSGVGGGTGVGLVEVFEVSN